MHIKAAVLRAHDAPHRIEDLDLGDPGMGEVRVRIAGAGLCHTDLLPRVPDYPAQRPLILGHEGSGVVEEVGPAVTGLRSGDHVVLSYDSCRSCATCLAGHPAYCATFFPRNLTGGGVDGPSPVRDREGQQVAARWFGQSSFATHALVASRNVVKVAKDLPLELLGPLGCGIQTGAGTVLLALQVAAGSSVIVFGTGAVGLSAIMAAHLAGAATIVAVDVNPARLDLARELGATHAFDGAHDGLPAMLEKVSGGAHYTIDTTGSPAVIATAVGALRPTGTCGLVGAPQGDVVLDSRVLMAGRNLRGISEGDAVPQVFIPMLIGLWRQGRFPFDKLIKTFPLDRINEAERATVTGEVVKPVLLP
ncbi:NAD(P)-dependent alcohol dehydrogenase [Nonomuraea sp. FMUSA5-5]|uniref:NAD(P)-dependent alcohol dehydrogenase n=1 Tax=Nonomuraea composti TaxID=2720023 RepID=A0ABX1BJ25_9ACTN|nr:NAD(P)-dependent alcohol dehydrogenase [Nonomuraea sp. FMUSA5-5]NJP97710.1 NAD(P)-dependent alcohol dehydrogenase [Nonomuraea sp. FMUSA5-5]